MGRKGKNLGGEEWGKESKDDIKSVGLVSAEEKVKKKNIGGENWKKKKKNRNEWIKEEI